MTISKACEPAPRARLTTWNLGATWAFAQHLSADLRYYDTNEHSFGKPYDGRAVVGLKASF